MVYRGYAQLSPGAPEGRLQELSRQLERQGCAVRIDRERAQLEFELGDDEGMWLKTGQLTLLLWRFHDVLTEAHHEYCELKA